MDESSAATQPRLAQLSDSGIRLLMVEYDRLKGLEVAFWDLYFKRFNDFMTATLALIGAYVALANLSSPLVPVGSPGPEILAALVFTWGIFTFLNLTQISYGIRHWVNAMNEIQRYFIENDQDLKSYLYFRRSSLYEAPAGILGKVEYQASRFLLRGSPKLVLAVLDSGLLAYLVAMLLATTRLLPVAVAAISILVFSVSGVLHAGYVRLIYRRNYIAD